MEIYDENLEFLKENAGELYSIITGNSPEFQYKAAYIQEEQNFYIESGNACCYMHSRYSVENECRMMFRSMPEDTEVVILFGVGCGHAVDYLLQNSLKVRYVIMVEPMLPVFRHFLERHRLSDMGKIGKFTCIINTNGEKAYYAMKHALSSELGSKLYFAFHVSYRTAFKDYYHFMQENVFRMIRSDKTMLSSGFSSYKIKALNCISNLKTECLPVENLNGLFKGRPAVIVSAGPSLNKNIHLLESLKNRAIIIAVGSAVKILENRGITPHFRMAFDWTQNEKEGIFDKLENRAVPLIFTDQLFHGILNEYDGIKFRMITMDGVIPIQVMKNANIDYDLNFSGISIANIALGLLCKMGCSHVVFMGQDMCFVDNKLYAEGRGQVRPEEYKKSLMEVRDIYGNKAYAVIQYLQIKYDLESVIKLYPGIRFINATEGGLGLDGVENMTLAEAMEKEIITDLTVNVDQYVKDNCCKGAMNAYCRKVATGVEALRPQLEETLEACIKILNVYRENKKEKGNGNKLKRIEKYCKKLEELEKEIEKQELYSDVAAKAIGPILKALLFKHENDNSERDTEKYYTNIGNRIIEKTLSILEYCLLLKQCIDNIFEM